MPRPLHSQTADLHSQRVPVSLAEYTHHPVAAVRKPTRQLRQPQQDSSSEDSSSEDDYGFDSDEYNSRGRSLAPPLSEKRARSYAFEGALPPEPYPLKAQTQKTTTAPVFNQLRNGRKGVFKPFTQEQEEDDDVPLAQRIPTALKAQKSIRKQVQQESDRKRRERSLAATRRALEGRRSPPPQVPEPVERGRSMTSTAAVQAASSRLPPGAQALPNVAPMSSSQEAAMMAQRSLHPPTRQRAKTLSGTAGVPAEELTNRLLKVQIQSQTKEPGQAPQVPRMPPVPAQHIRMEDSSTSLDRVSSTSRHSPQSPQPGGHSYPTSHASTEESSAAPTRTLRSMRSFHGIAPAEAVPPLPSALERRPTSSRGRKSNEVNQHPHSATEDIVRSRSVKRPSHDRPSRPSTEAQDVYSSPVPQLPPLPPIPASVPLLPPMNGARSRPASPSRGAFTSSNTVQTRVYISDMQRFNVVEIGPGTNAKDVLEMLQHQGDLRNEQRFSSSWMLYEVCHDFGMERPIRNFEHLTDISGSWSKEKTMNCFMVKPSPYSLSLATVPSSIPIRSGPVDYETKKGKWNRRWLELREHGLWLSKNQGKNDEFLCSLSVFDAYIVTRIHKSSKPFVFAIKSTDPITLFENKSDYLHVFSVPEDNGKAWVEAIWLARSYILYQEKNVLFQSKPKEGGGANLARSGTRKKPAQTYVNIGPSPGVPTAGPFEPGSLLAKRA